MPIGEQRMSAPFDWLVRLAAARAASAFFDPADAAADKA
jgi:hypothetical protein